ncbi:MAG: bifunctional 5,10-methylenetetrahydrofolate dehydrogenase/5,10-methenyltetrahydrofolate cyclohydrolase [Rickettsiales bacterium]|jgi:methylenetetrahydrofolate dehydrogenase (NADP+)/methenyltetrahydrofolate cyclohydrolase|nr:bifunctional 5,10-methylenetetrahydrofolate dehydrogenase/5,10-methenyltetrahydrofolate cyclohydrolase [Rickettsiales bacterium]
MTILLDGRGLAEEITARLKAEVAAQPSAPNLKVILVGNDPASLMYDNAKVKKAKELGIESELVRLPATASEEELLSLIDRFNKDQNVNGILVQLPLPSHIDESLACGAVAPWKDVDGFHPLNKGLLSMGDEAMLAPCTPLGIITLLEHYGIELDGARACIVGSSNIVGKPMQMLLANRGATTTLCNVHTRGLSEMTHMADILISAVGKESLITADMVKDDAVVVDVAMVHSARDGSLCGDVDFEEVAKKASAITPSPGGVGPMTIITLMMNTLKAYKIRRGIGGNENPVQV